MDLVHWLPINIIDSDEKKKFNDARASKDNTSAQSDKVTLYTYETCMYLCMDFVCTIIFANGQWLTVDDTSGFIKY